MNPQQPENEPTWNPTPVEQPTQEQPQAPDTSDQPVHAEQQDVISWEASESVHHEKDMTWFVGIIAAGVLFASLSIFLLKSITFTVLIIVMVIAILVLAKRPPRVLRYQLSERGIMIEQKSYEFHEFRSFGVVQDGPFYYIVLLPVKRFMPSIDVYFPEEYGEDIVDLLGDFVPMQAIQPDALDKITKHLRF